MSRSAPPHELGIPEHNDGIADRLRSGMVFVPGGTFRMGSDHHYPEEAPSHRVSVDSFWIDEAPVTNAEFRRFVDATNYVCKSRSNNPSQKRLICSAAPD